MKTLSYTTFIASLGSALEYYDFVVFAMLANIITQVFFSGAGGGAGFLKTMAVLGLGYLARPIGGVILGSFGDRYGRKQVFLFNMILMAGSTAGIGLLPSYQQAGYFSIGLLLLLRLIQGFAVGGELPGAITFLLEHSPQPERGFRNGWLFFGVGCGGLLSAFLTYLITNYLTLQHQIAWGWRLPFLLGGILAVVAYYMRRDTVETPMFLKLNSAKINKPFSHLVRNYPYQIIAGISIVLFAATFITFGIFLPSYLARYYQYHAPQVYLAQTIGYLWGAFLLPILGRLSDAWRRQKILLTVAVCAMIFIPHLFAILNARHSYDIYVFIGFYHIFTGFIMTSYPVLVGELFPTEVRYTGVAASYNIAYCLGGLVPLLAGFMIEHSHSPQSVIWLFEVMSVLVIITLLSVYGFAFQKRVVSAEI